MNDYTWADMLVDLLIYIPATLVFWGVLALVVYAFAGQLQVRARCAKLKRSLRR